MMKPISLLFQPKPAHGVSGLHRASSAGGKDHVRRRGRKVAYLVNAYPKVSHSFIQTEIEALERLGLSVERLTVRRSRDALGSQDDPEEADRTAALLDGNYQGLAGATLARLLKRPRSTLLALMAVMRWHGRQSPVRALAYFAEATYLAERLERLQIKHVHVHFGTNPAVVARLAARMAPITYSFTAHGPDEFDSPRALDLAGKIAEAAFTVGVSSFGRGQLMRWSDPAHWPRLEVVRCAVAPRFLQSAGSSQGLWSNRLVCVARLDAQKGLPLLLEAVSRLARRQSFRLDIIGDGPGRRDLEAMIAKRELAPYVSLLGWRPPSEVRQAILDARALVLPSFAEGLPVVLMEALALGRPVIASAVAGIPELVNADNGWLVPAGSLDALEAAVEHAIDAPAEQLLSMGQAGRERVMTLHHPDRSAAELARLLEPHL